MPPRRCVHSCRLRVVPAATAAPPRLLPLLLPPPSHWPAHPCGPAPAVLPRTTLPSARAGPQATRGRKQGQAHPFLARYRHYALRTGGRQQPRAQAEAGTTPSPRSSVSDVTRGRTQRPPRCCPTHGPHTTRESGQQLRTQPAASASSRSSALVLYATRGRSHATAAASTAGVSGSWCRSW